MPEVLAVTQTVAAWADRSLTLEDAVRHLLARAETRCDRALAWSLLDVSAARVVAFRVKELGFCQEEAR